METVTGRLRVHLADRYRFEREIGAGGMATVYLAEDVKHHRRVALKVLRPELSALLGAERFLKEIEVTANLQHPHLLPLFDSGEVDGLLFYVMPFVEGESLRQRLTRERQLGIEEAVRITTQVASALDHAHRHGVIHRDIKPENILLHEGQALVADFGIALALREAGGDRLTQTGLSLGTPQYMSPEQAAGDRVLDARSDVYSLASVLYEMLAGEPPHSGPTVQSVIAKLLADAPRPVTDLRRTVPLNIAGAIDVALAKLPADRFESTAEFARALAEPNARRASSVIRPPADYNTSLVGWRTASGVAGAAALVLALLLWRSAQRSQGMAPTTRYREVVALAPSVTRPLSSRIAIAPDGSRLVYVGSDSARRLWVRAADSLDGYPLPGTEGAENPFFSPDGLRVGFKTADKNFLSAVALEGGLSSTPMQFTAGISGAAWANDGFIYAASLQLEQRSATKLGLVRGTPAGNSREQVTTLDRSRGELDHNGPSRYRMARASASWLRVTGAAPRMKSRWQISRAIGTRC